MYTFQLSKQKYNRNNDDTNATVARTEPTRKSNRKFHDSGHFLGLTLSYPIAMRVPSFNKVINISINTGIWKNPGHSYDRSG